MNENNQAGRSVEQFRRRRFTELAMECSCHTSLRLFYFSFCSFLLPLLLLLLSPLPSSLLCSSPSPLALLSIPLLFLEQALFFQAFSNPRSQQLDHLPWINRIEHSSTSYNDVGSGSSSSWDGFLTQTSVNLDV